MAGSTTCSAPSFSTSSRVITTRSLSGAPGRVMRNLGPGRREEHGLAPVPPADHVRRRAVGPVDPDDLAVTLLVALVATLDRQLVAHLCSHDRPPRDVVVSISLKGRGHPRQGRWSRWSRAISNTSAVRRPGRTWATPPAAARVHWERRKWWPHSSSSTREGPLGGGGA